MHRILFLAFVLSFNLSAKEIDTNSVIMKNAPDWMSRNRAEKIIDRMQMHLEWTIRKANVIWYTSVDEFIKAHSLGPNVVAVSRQRDNTIHLGPKVDNVNFDQIFGHELVHIIFFQKYKEAIPQWLEEGLANYYSKRGKVDYGWLAKKPFPPDVRQLTHPHRGTVDDMHYHYQASHALAEMIAKKCDLPNLLRLSVGMKMDDYLKTYCEINDLNGEFKKWILARSK
jgi:hypothetical protein